MMATVAACAFTATAADAHFMHYVPHPQRLTPAAELRYANAQIRHARFVLDSMRFLAAFGPFEREVVRDHRWLLSYGKQLRREALRRLHPRVLVPSSLSWLAAVDYVQRWYPGSGSWLRSCSSSEGGWGGFVWRGHNSTPDSGDQVTPGGWLQYMQRTFWGDFHSAIRDLASRGIHVPYAWWNYYLPTGQAVAGAWAYGHDRPAGKWTGSGC